MHVGTILDEYADKDVVETTANDDKNKLSGATDGKPTYAKLSAQIRALYDCYGKDWILLIRVGSFYEMYGDQALEWHHHLGLLMSRKGLCGFPDSAVRHYVTKLVKDFGQRVAVIDQLRGEATPEQQATSVPLQNGETRYVKRFYTPATTMVAEGELNYLAAVHVTSSTPMLLPSDPVTITFCDLLTHESNYIKTDVLNVPFVLLGISPAEIIFPDALLDKRVAVRDNVSVAAQEEYLRNRAEIERERCETMAQHDADVRRYQDDDEVTTENDAASNAARPDWDSFLAMLPATAMASARPAAEFTAAPTDTEPDAASRHALRQYLHHIYIGRAPTLATTDENLAKRHMIIDKTTARQLELFQTVGRNSRVGSMVRVLGKPKTRSGERMIKRSLLFPLTDRAELEERFDRLDALRAHPMVLDEVRQVLDQIGDSTPIEEICSAIDMEFATFDSLKTLLENLLFARKLAQILHPLPAFATDCRHLTAHDDLLRRLLAALDLSDSTALVLAGTDPSLAEFSTELVRLQQSVDDLRAEFCTRFGFPITGKSPVFRAAGPKVSKRRLRAAAEMQKLDAELAGMDGLVVDEEPTVSEDAELGGVTAGASDASGRPLVELTHVQYANLPADARQQFPVVSKTKTVVRIEYDKWTRLQLAIAELRSRVQVAEQSVLQDLMARAREQIPSLVKTAHAVALLDMTQVFCTFADRFNCVRPKFTDDHTMVLKQVIHPVIYESALEAGRHVVPNDCELDHDKCLIVISGANMGGKTCFMRTVGAAVILAQIGCPVPAISAQLPIYDAIYTRFGSYDDLAHNQSTFAAEMADLRRILSKGTPRSLVLMDELGRGTGPNDAMALVAAVCETLVNRHVPTLTTTHMHALVDVIRDHCGGDAVADRIRCIHSACYPVKDGGETFWVVDYRMRPGMAESSFGVEIASWTKLPKHVLGYAMEARETLRVGHLQR
ncbi:DNA mismatch repair ATPase msh1 [Allomyces javanicus]|nr:DNA mismatch repair ATPase msh1 [Allomyces javanicus]